MEEMNEARITGEVLRWARERRGLDFAQLAQKSRIGIEQLRQWEAEVSFPPFGKAEDLAKILKIPFGLLFLPTPPKDGYPIPDFRTVDADAGDSPSPDLIEVINQVATKQEWYREFSEQDSKPRVPVVGSFRIPDGVAAVARDIAKTLNITEDLRRSCRDFRVYLKHLSENAQAAGILVMRSGVVGNDSHRPLSVAEFRGFSLTDPYAPAVFINGKDAVAAQVFTLIHELTHIWINQSGISNPDPSEIPGNRFEVFCDAVAAEVLVPSDDFEAAWNLVRDKAYFPSTLSRTFWVSPLVVIRRARDLHKISEDEFFRLVKIEKSKVFETHKSKGGNPTATLLSRNGLRLTLVILGAVSENRLVYRDAAHLLNVNIARIPKLLTKRLS